MICFKDQEFCDSDCTNDECFRNYGPQQQAEALQWWGGDGAPIAMSKHHRVNCQWYKEPV